jgi:hypothetical protein
MKSASVAVLMVLAAMVPPAAFAAENYERFSDRISIYLGGFWPTSNSELSIDGALLPPIPPIDIEEALNVEEGKGVAWGGVSWRISRRHHLEFEYFDLRRSGGRSGDFEPPLQIGDTIIESGGVDTSYNTSIGRVTYGFAAIASERARLEVKAGVHIARLEAGIGLSGQLCTPTTTPSTPPGCPTEQTSGESTDITAPLPHFGLSYAYALTESLAIKLQGIGFAVKIQDIDGSILELDADLVWKPTRRFGVGAGVRYFRSRVDYNENDLLRRFEIGYLGPVLYVTGSF